jgi:porphobilinogen synthase
MNERNFQRTRRNRKKASLRALVRETNLSSADFIQPLFVRPGSDVKREIPSMPGQYQYSVDRIAEEALRVEDTGVPAVILFGIPEEKDERASRAYAEDGIIQKALREIKDETRDLTLIADVCLCEYMSHGHCGVISGEEGNRTVDNDRTLPLISKTALAAVEAGADVVAPSGMMDGMVQAIRTTLDDNDFSDIPILSYAAKYESSFYGPFRDAAESPPQFGDRARYQMDPANSDEAMREIRLDVRQEADMIMVKPALSYLDVIHRASTSFDLPVFAYSVSGEYAMIKAAASNGWLDERSVALEMLTSIRRAGADAILTYWATSAAGWLDDL